MTETLPAALTRQCLDELRQGASFGDIMPEAEIVSGIRFVPDPDAGMRGRFSSPAGRLLQIEVTHERPARWCGLHIRLDIDDISDLGLIGLAARFAAPQAVAVAPCIRSGTENGFSDCFFEKQVASLPRPLLHLDAIETDGRHPSLPETAPWRELVLFLPTGGFRLDLHDLKVFAA